MKPTTSHASTHRMTGDLKLIKLSLLWAEHTPSLSLPQPHELIYVTFLFFNVSYLTSEVHNPNNQIKFGYSVLIELPWVLIKHFFITEGHIWLLTISTNAMWCDKRYLIKCYCDFQEPVNNHTLIWNCEPTTAEPLNCSRSIYWRKFLSPIIGNVIWERCPCVCWCRQNNCFQTFWQKLKQWWIVVNTNHQSQGLTLLSDSTDLQITFIGSWRSP